MFDENKLNEIRQYLTKEFKGYDLAEKYDFDRLAQTFRLVRGSNIHLITVSEEFIEDNSSRQISSILNASNLSSYFHNHQVLRVIVTTSGIKTET